MVYYIADKRMVNKRMVKNIIIPIDRGGALSSYHSVHSFRCFTCHFYLKVKKRKERLKWLEAQLQITIKYQGTLLCSHAGGSVPVKMGYEKRVALGVIFSSHGRTFWRRMKCRRCNGKHTFKNLVYKDGGCWRQKNKSDKEERCDWLLSGISKFTSKVRGEDKHDALHCAGNFIIPPKVIYSGEIRRNPKRLRAGSDASKMLFTKGSAQ